jgi:uncharacterized protein (TIGR00369 family)
MSKDLAATEHKQRLDAWLADEASLRQRQDGGLGPGVSTIQEIAHLNGLEQMRGILEGRLHFAPIARALDFFMVEVEHGRAVFQGTPSLAFYNPLGTVHGGWFTTLLDSALGCAVHSTMPVGKAYTTAELSVNMVRAITTKVPRVRAEGKVVHVGRQLATAEARLVGPDGTLYAHGTTTCLVFDLPSAR